jgi:hypothetical protein
MAARHLPPGGEVEEDHTVIHCQDIREVKAKLDDVAETLNSLAVQEQKIATILESILSIRKEQADTNARLTKLQSDHDRCQISAAIADISWLKWFVMGNTIALLGMVIGLITKLLQHS